jgi:hypothetical protein
LSPDPSENVPLESASTPHEDPHPEHGKPAYQKYSQWLIVCNQRRKECSMCFPCIVVGQLTGGREPALIHEAVNPVETTDESEVNHTAMKPVDDVAI